MNSEKREQRIWNGQEWITVHMTTDASSIIGLGDALDAYKEAFIDPTIDDINERINQLEVGGNVSGWNSPISFFEEGIFQAQFRGGNTLMTQETFPGQYTRIGSKVLIILFATVGGTRPPGEVRITGLPFPPVNRSVSAPVGQWHFANDNNPGIVHTYNGPWLTIRRMWAAHQDLPAGEFFAPSIIFLTATYQTNI